MQNPPQPHHLGPSWPCHTGTALLPPSRPGIGSARVEPRPSRQPTHQPMQLHSAAESFSTVCHVFCTSMKDTAS